MAFRINKENKSGTGGGSVKEEKTSRKVKSVKNEDIIKTKKTKEEAKKSTILRNPIPESKSDKKSTSTPRPVIKSVTDSRSTPHGSMVAVTSMRKNNEKRVIKGLDLRKTHLIGPNETKINDKPLSRTNVTVNSPKHRKTIKDVEPIGENLLNIDVIKHNRYPTRTLETEDIKVLNRNKSPENPSHIKDTPSAQPKAFFVPINDNPQKSTVHDDGSDSYEDDFESYESDFESYASSKSLDDKSDSISNGDNKKDEIKSKLEDDKKFDSGNYELGETSKNNYSVDNSKHLITQDLNHTSLTDEGFDENSLGQSISLKIIEKQQSSTNNKNVQRFKDLKELIILDEIKYSLFEMSPMDYDTFITVYGKSNMIQSQCQTNDDNVHVDIQTDVIHSNSIWTQFPVDFSQYILLEDHKVNNAKRKQFNMREWSFKKINPLEAYINQRLGSGSADIISQPAINKKTMFESNKNIINFSKFINRAGGFILEYLSETSSSILGPLSTNEKQFKTFDKMLHGRPVEKLLAAGELGSLFLTLHPGLKTDLENHSISSLKSFVCVWTLRHRLIEPVKILVCSDKIECCVLSGGLSGLVVAGLNNGNICAWDLQESNMWHNTRDLNGEEKIEFDHPEKTDLNVMRKCSFYSGMVKTKFNTWGPVIDVAILRNTRGDNKDNISDKTNNVATQVFTLQEFGLLTIWTVVKKLGDINKMTNTSMFDNCDAYWSRISLVRSSIVNLNLIMKNCKSCESNEKQVSWKNDDSNDKHPPQKKGGIIRAFTDEFADVFDERLEAPKKSDLTQALKQEFQTLILCKSFKYSASSNSLLIICNGCNIVNYSLGSLSTNRNIFSCDDGGSYITGLELCPSGLPYFLASCGSNIIHLYSFNVKKPIKNFIFNSAKLFANPDTQPSATLKLSSGALNRWYGKGNIGWLPGSMYSFLSYHESFGIFLWDLTYSDILPKACLYRTDGSKENKILNITVLNDAMQNNLMALQMNNGDIKIYKLENEENKLKGKYGTKSFLATYFESL